MILINAFFLGDDFSKESAVIFNKASWTILSENIAV